MSGRPEGDAIQRAWVLFGIPDHHCCDCCAGYCPADDYPDGRWEDLYTLTVAGVAHVGTRYIMVRADLVEIVDGRDPQPVTTAPTWAVPDAVPPVAAPHQMPTAQVLDRIDRAGLTCHVGEDRYLHLYLGRQHVGWTRSTSRSEWGCDPADLPALRRAAHDARVSIDQAQRVMVSIREGSQ